MAEGQAPIRFTCDAIEQVQQIAEVLRNAPVSKEGTDEPEGTVTKFFSLTFVNQIADRLTECAEFLEAQP